MVGCEAHCGTILPPFLSYVKTKLMWTLMFTLRLDRIALRVNHYSHCNHFRLCLQTLLPIINCRGLVMLDDLEHVRRHGLNMCDVALQSLEHLKTTQVQFETECNLSETD